MRSSRTVLIVLMCISIMLSTSGCATIMSGSKQEIPVNSEPPGAKVTADDGTSIITPGKLVLERKNSHTLVAEYADYETQQQVLKPKLNNWVWGNILIGGIIGLVIDIVSGSVNELKPKEVQFNFGQTPEESSEEVSMLDSGMVLN